MTPAKVAVMETTPLNSLKVGDQIKFRVAVRDGVKTATRPIRSFWINGNPQVRFWGCGEFVIRLNEIKEVNGEAV
jgi:hypothetical protein